ncbi:voltage-gated chloride channel protein [Thermoclostridium stercorarium subsp. leptospartum DSM 9219]|jgi:H+/Cl- antiporter ClcA|uniref:Voltage-gated chloride channel protein n=2 Tax=Thermoclostridium stercorarium TaxID=1510 RepID=A0A1B1YNC9_THEST|nr:chloride channel protein [Thermoclostridium stercorarium]ANX02242.1 voltage-gated chloride channel protein [Thermoclostridium stercorarium subsp. leptospartum DSM 9219]
MSWVKMLLNRYRNEILLGVAAVFLGILIGAVETLFGRVLTEVGEIRQRHFFQLTPFLPIAGMLIMYTYSTIGANSVKGMSLIFSAAFGEEESIPKRLVPLLMGSTWLTHLFGGSAGREGAAVQIGGTIAYSVGKKLNIENRSKVLLITGMTAGFAGMFQTPMAAAFFAMEVFTAGVMEYCAMFPSIIASFAAYYTSRLLGLEKLTVGLNCTFSLSIFLILKIILLGVIFGITGGLFAYVFSFSRSFLNKRINNPILRIFIMGCILSVLVMVLHGGRYSGSGENLIEAAFFHEKVYPYDWLFKFMLTILTMSAGFQGGEVTPLFSIGASLGVVLAPVFGLPGEFVSALGFVAVFGSATNTVLAPVFVGAEIFGYDYLPYFFIISTVAYVFSGNKSIYPAQRVYMSLNG